MVTVDCPVTGCDYRNRPASVAAHISGKKDDAHDWEKLDYSGSWDFRESARGAEKDNTSLLHMTDSHIGKYTGGFHGRGWSVDCMAGFERAIDKAIELNVDAVVHTGDLFHNDKHGITKKQSFGVGYQLARLHDEDILFYYILGDHERELGGELMDTFGELGLARNLNQTPIEIGSHIALYGQNHRPSSFWQPKHWNPDHPGGRISILALHQSLAPFTGNKEPDVHVADIGQWTVNRAGFSFDAIALGQLHREIDEILGGTRAICGGATERLGKTRTSIAGSVGLFQAGSSGLSYERVNL